MRDANNFLSTKAMDYQSEEDDGETSDNEEDEEEELIIPMENQEEEEVFSVPVWSDCNLNDMID